MFQQVKRISRPDVNSLLHGGLLTLLLLGYAGLVYVLVIAVGRAPFGDIREPNFSPPWWLNALALGLIATTFLPIARLLRNRTYDLSYAEHDNPDALVSRITRQLQTIIALRHGLPRLAQATGTEMRLPYVVIEVTGAEPPLCASFGTLPARAITTDLPATYMEKQLGVLTVPRVHPKGC